ncbi:hypothetical protein [Pantoea sp. 18069]|uniref:hypothetical protein n=1 Tax=Pantoea sp. 18069 TaxID=2681415 RepID=UPI00135B0E78|nr:hypothetical protein [Pantoea sp. 18069]
MQSILPRVFPECLRADKTLAVDQTEDAMQQADAALYRGKAGGRNRIESAQVAGLASAQSVAASFEQALQTVD